MTDAMEELLDQPLQGLIGGQPWTAQLGITDPVLSSDAQVYAHLTSGSLTCEDVPRDTGVHLRIPTREAEYSLSESRVVMITLTDGTELDAIEGVLQVHAVTQDTLRGALRAYVDDANYVEGDFTVVRCE